MELLFGLTMLAFMAFYVGAAIHAATDKARGRAGVRRRSRVHADCQDAIANAVRVGAAACAGR